MLSFLLVLTLEWKLFPQCCVTLKHQKCLCEISVLFSDRVIALIQKHDFYTESLKKNSC